MTILAAALRYASDLGWAVFPLAPGTKRPAISKADGGNGYKDATTHIETIKRWWVTYPNANIGIPCGHRNGFFVVDVDNKHEPAGDIELEDLMDSQGLPPCWVVQTPNRGRHLYFAMPSNGRSVASFHPNGKGNLDIQSDGCYIVAPPSEADGRSYVEESDYSGLTVEDWFLDRLDEYRAQRERNPDSETVEAVTLTVQGETTPDGSRGNALFNLAASMRGQGCTSAAIFAALLEDNKRCLPPKPESELVSIARSAGTYDANAVLPLTDAGNSERMVHTYGSRLRYCRSRRTWYLWDGVIWKPDDTGKIYNYCLNVLRLMYHTTSEIIDDDVRMKMAVHARKSEAMNRRLAMVDGAAPMAPIAIRAEELDTHRMLLPVQNGTIELETGAFRDSLETDLMTRQATSCLRRDGHVSNV